MPESAEPLLFSKESAGDFSCPCHSRKRAKLLTNWTQLVLVLVLCYIAVFMTVDFATRTSSSKELDTTYCKLFNRDIGEKRRLINPLQHRSILSSPTNGSQHGMGMTFIRSGPALHHQSVIARGRSS